MTTVASVLTERVIVCRIDVLTIVSNGWPSISFTFSRIRSRMTIVSINRVADDRQDRGQEGVVHPLSGDRVDPDHGQRVAHQRDQQTQPKIRFQPKRNAMYRNWIEIAITSALIALSKYSCESDGSDVEISDPVRSTGATAP